MVRNDIRDDFAEICRSEQVTKTEAGRRIGMSRQAVDKLWKGKTISRKYVEIMDGLGYDIVIHYIKK